MERRTPAPVLNERDPELAFALSGLSALVVAMLMVIVRGELRPEAIALVLAVTVAVAGRVGGREGGVAAALISAVAFNFFHTRPYLSLHIESRADVETVIILLAVGVIVGTVAAREHRYNVSTSEYDDELRSIHQVSVMVADGAEPLAVVGAATDALRTVLHLRACRYEDAPFAATYPSLNRHGSTGGGLATYIATRTGLELPAEGVVLPVRSAGETVGRFVLSPTPGFGVSRHARLAAVVVADHVGTVFGRFIRS